MISIGFIIGKKLDEINYKDYSKRELDYLPDKYTVSVKTAQDGYIIPIDAALGWYIKEKYNVNVNLIKPSEISEQILLKNNVNYIIGFELTDLLSEIGMGKGNKERYNMIQKIFKNSRKYNIHPSWPAQNFINQKGKYLRHLEKAGIPIAPTYLVKTRNHFTLKSIRKIITNLRNKGWNSFVVKPEGAAGSFGFIKLSINDAPAKLQGHLNRFKKLFKTFILQETMKGFSEFVEIRTFWYGEKFAYAIGTKDSSIGAEKVIKVPSNSLEVCKKLSSDIFKAIPQLKDSVIVRMDFGCCRGNTLDNNLYFLNEVELEGANWYPNYTPYPIIEEASKLFVKETERLTGRKIDKIAPISRLKKIAKNKKMPLYTRMDKEQLVSAASDNEFSIGWRWNYIKKVLVKKKEAREVMNMLLSPVRDLRKYPTVMKFLEKNKVYITLTTSPIRLSKLTAALATIDFTNLEKIFIILPQQYGRDKAKYSERDIENISKFPKVQVIRRAKDYGPISKMLPALRRIRNKKSIMISMDDDIAYPMGMVNEMIYQKVMKYPNGVLHTSPGMEIRKDMDDFSKLWPGKRPRTPFTDLVEGWSAIAYSPGLTDTKLMEKFSKLSKSCYLSDDLVISYVLAARGIPKVSIYNDYIYSPSPYEYGTGDDALHKGDGGTEAHSNEYNYQKYEICLKDISKYCQKNKC